MRACPKDKVTNIEMIYEKYFILKLRNQSTGFLGIQLFLFYLVLLFSLSLHFTITRILILSRLLLVSTGRIIIDYANLLCRL